MKEIQYRQKGDYLVPDLKLPEQPEVIARFKALVRADGHDVGKGLLKMFVASIAIFAFMWGIGKIITL